MDCRGCTTNTCNTRLLDTFKSKLSGEWKRQAARNCHFYHVNALREWMNQREKSEGNPAELTNADRLLRTIEDKAPNRRAFPVDAHLIFHGEDQCILVFSILMEQGRGELIDVFRKANIFDRNLGYVESTSVFHQQLREKLQQIHVPDAEIDLITKDFESKKWAYCAPSLELHMDKNFETGEIILPYCKCERVNEKGGTASVFQVSVQKEFIHQDLQMVLEKSIYKDSKYGDVRPVP
jgi:hypothetical protein